jgi:hypothetical protein
MIPIHPSRRRPLRRSLKPRACLQVEFLETRNLMASTLGLTPLVQVSDPSPLDNSIPPNGTVFLNSEVEPQLAVDPTNLSHAVAIWQQDRYRSGGGARALVVSVNYNADDPAGATWSTPAAIPGFNAAVANPDFGRYTDPWVSFAPNGDVYASALALTVIGPFPYHTASQVVKSTDGGFTWSAPATLIDNQAPPGTDPIDLANDKEAVTADPTNANDAYVIWDRLNHPGDQQNFNAFHGLPFREDALFARTTDGGATWEPAQNLTNFKANESAFGNQIVVEPDGTLVDVFTHLNGSGNQNAKADQSTVGVMRSTDQGLHWSDIIDGPAEEVIDVTDPDTGGPVRDGEPILDAAVDPSNGNLYTVWVDARFSGFAHDDIAFSMSTDGGLTWSTPIKVNQAPVNIPAGDQQAFTPSVAVAADGTVAVTFYDFRNNTAATGLATDYWLAHASGNLTNPSSWSSDEKRLTSTSFDMEQAPPTSRGYFLGDYDGLAAAGNNFYALFGQAGSSASDSSNIWFRDPPPAPGAMESLRLAGGSTPTAVYLFDVDDPAGVPTLFVGQTSDTFGPGVAPQANGSRSDGVHATSGLTSFRDKALSSESSSAAAIDRLFADSEDPLSSDALGSEVLSGAVD